MSQLVLALFIIGVGLCTAGMLTHLYQGLFRETAGIRIYGASPARGLFNLVTTFFCGPYIMLRLGWQSGEAGQISVLNVLLAAFIAFAWSFVTGLIILGSYVTVIRALV
ncbi:DUF6949 family protein [Pelagibacterium limicola]|uniref:DUF6949 family protein n=1 Tax=Pelagibacterium limicola TaxID=2791022 RepID=UPI0018AF8C6B|nr:hypothetical protein [Pelagibacterium limicola]